VTDEELAAAVTLLLANLRPASRFHLETALSAAATEGVSGTLVVSVPRRPGDPIDVSFMGGQTRLVLDV